MSKFIKYFIFALLIAISLFAAGELQPEITSYKLNDASLVTYRVDNDLQPEDVRQIASLLSQTAEQNGAGIFVSEFEVYDDFNETRILYYTPAALEHIKTAMNGNYSYESFLTGKVDYSLRPMSELSITHDSLDVRFCGDDTAVSYAKRDLRKVLTVEYSENMRPEAVENYIKIAVFVLAALIIILFSLFDLNLQRKEFIIKCIYGESKIALAMKGFATDALVLCTETAGIFFVVSKLNSVACCRKEILIFTASLLAGIFVSYLTLLRARPVYTLKGQENTKKILSACHVLKLALSVMLVCAISVLIALLIDSRTYIKTSDLFKSHSDYYFVSAVESHNYHGQISTEKPVSLNNSMAYEHYGEYLPLMLDRDYYASTGEPGENGYYIFANSNASDYLRSAIKEISNVEFDKDYVIILPEKDTNSKLIDDTLYEINCRYNKFMESDIPIYTRENVQIIKTSRSYEVFATDDDKSSGMGVYKNEPVVLCTLPENTPGNILEEMNLSSNNYYMFKLNDRQKEQLVKDNSDMNIYFNGCKAQYDHYWRTERIGLVYFSTFSVILIILEFVLLSLTVKSEFELNKEELCIKKILGYRLLSRYGELIAGTLISSFICFGLSVFALSRMDTSVPFMAAIAVSSALLALEFCMLVYFAAKLEKANIQKALKGGAL